MRNVLRRSMILVIIMMAAVTSAAEANDDLNNIVEVRTSDGAAESEASEMIHRLSNIDDRILYEANRSGTRVILMDVPLTDLPEFQHLSGIVPRGWESNGSTWDEVPGAGGYITAARIGYSEPGNGHSTSNLELHEFGHAVDSYVGGFTISESGNFRDIMSREKDTLFSDHVVPEYFDVPSEYFAEVFSMYYLGGSEREKLQTRAPETYHFISTLHNRLVSIGEITGNTMTIHWDDTDGAESYNIYQNGEKVDEVDSGEESYTAEELNVSSNYEFSVAPVDASGNEMFRGFFRIATTNAEEDPGQLDTDELESLVELAKAKVAAEDEEDTDLNAAIEEAEALLEDVSSDDVEQSDIQNMTEALATAVEEAENKWEENSNQPDTENLENILASANQLVNHAGFDDDDLNAAIEEAEALLEASASGDVDETDIDYMTETLESAIEEAENRQEDDEGTDGTDTEGSDTEDTDEPDNESDESTEPDDSEEESVEGSTDTESTEAANNSNSFWMMIGGGLIILAIGLFIFLFIRRK